MPTKFDGISEFISRRGRVKLLEILVREFGSRSKAAHALGFSKSTISGWLNEDDRHPSNSSLDRVLRQSRKKNPGDVREILDDELETFEKAIKVFVRGGANSPTNES